MNLKDFGSPSRRYVFAQIAAPTFKERKRVYAESLRNQPREREIFIF